MNSIAWQMCWMPRAMCCWPSRCIRPCWAITSAQARPCAALDRQERPVEPQVVRTPRTGHGYAQRVLTLLGQGGLPVAWSALNDPRAQSEPRVNAWIGALLGNPGRIRLAARVLRRGPTAIHPMRSGSWPRR